MISNQYSSYCHSGKGGSNTIRKIMVGLIAFLLISTVAVSLFDLSLGTVSADNSGGFNYVLINNGTAVQITGYTGSNTDVVIPSTIANLPVTSIGDNAFYEYQKMTSLTFASPSHVTYIGNYSFYWCNELNTGLSKVIIPDSVTAIGTEAFANCGILSDVTIGNGTLSIGAGAFENDGDLRSVIMGSAVSNIGPYAFVRTAISTVNIPSSVTSIGLGAFSDISYLYAINVDPNNPNYTSLNGMMYNKGMTTLLQYAGESGSSGLLIPDGVVIIGGYACDGAGITSVTFPSSVTTIQDDAFASCAYMTYANIGSGVTNIGNASFAGDSSLYSVTFYGLVAPTNVSSNWISGTATNITGHASVSSNFPAPGNVWNGLTMGAAPSAVAPGTPPYPMAKSGPGYILLSWGVPTNVGYPILTQYDVYRSTTYGSNGVLIGSAPASSTPSYNDTTVTPGTLYYYVVTSVNSAGASPISGQAEGQATSPTSGSQAPSAPQNLVTSNGNNSVTLSWSAPANAGSPSLTRYDIYRGATVSSIGTTPIGNVAAGTLTYTDATAANNNTYVYVVKAVNSVGSSTASNTAQGSPSISSTSRTGTTSDNSGIILGVVIVIVIVVVVGLLFFVRSKRKNTPPK